MTLRVGRRRSVVVALAAVLLVVGEAGAAAPAMAGTTTPTTTPAAAAPSASAPGTTADDPASGCTPTDPAAIVAAGDPLVLGRSAEQVNGYTRVEVDEVWSGPDVAPEIWIVTGAQQTRRFGRDANPSDVVLASSTEYLIAFDADYRTDRCSVRQASDALLTSRPAEVRAPVEGAATGVTPHEAPVGGLTIVSYGVVGGLVLVVVLAVLLESRRRRAHPR